MYATHELSNQYNVEKRMQVESDTSLKAKEKAYIYFRDLGYKIHHVQLQN